MSAKPILPNLVFTRSTGSHETFKGTTFNDAIDHGGFPTSFTINGIKQINVFSDTRAGEKAVITGLTIQYYGVEEPVSHGTVVGVAEVGTLMIDSATHLLVGVFGRLKDLPNVRTLNNRIASIGFVVLNKYDGNVTVKGPYVGASDSLGTPWATFGPIIALQGTTKDGIGLTTLGFVKSIDGIPCDIVVVNKGVDLETNVPGVHFM